MSEALLSWGRFPDASHRVERVFWRSGTMPFAGSGSYLPRGLGRSYGDVCLNDGGVLLTTRGLNRFVDFDEASGVLTCESGVSLAEVLETFVPRGWFPPVTPGTRFVTVGGCIANDVHGKNHHGAGTFGCHVLTFELVRSTGERLRCSPESNPDFFRATIGGLGLTGLITTASIRLEPIRSRKLDVETIRFGCLREFFALSRESEQHFRYTVAWVDCMASGQSLGRGLFMRGNHREDGVLIGHGRPLPLAIPFDFPRFALNPFTVKAFNTIYYHKQVRRVCRSIVDYTSFFYPLDAVLSWNRIYGKRGFLQYQCVVPYKDDGSSIKEIFSRIAKAKLGSFLAVLKVFGNHSSPGMLSFPRSGVTLALDFPNSGARIFGLLDELDSIVSESGGAINPSKDARMAPAMFRQSFPNWLEFTRYIDPQFSSSFWRRVTETPL